MEVVCGASAEKWKQRIVSSYDIGEKTEFLKIRSAYDKGREGNRKRSITDALGYPYIQPNSEFNLRWMVFDVDRDLNVTEIDERNLPAPNLVVTNPQNGHAHLWYGLENPVYQQSEFSNSRALKYAKAIYNAMCSSLGADVHFNRKLCKNPLHPSWSTISMCDELYELSDIASHLDINWKETDRSVERDAGRVASYAETAEDYGGADKGSRNSSLFEYARIRAYRHRMTADCTEREFIGWCVECVKQADLRNPEPLKNDVNGDKELVQIGESIGRWVWAKMRPLKESVTRFDDAARARSLAVRRQKAALKLRKIARLLKKKPGISNRGIARELGKGFSTDTVNRAVKKIMAGQRERAETAKKSREEAVGRICDIACERFVNQVVGVSPYIMAYNDGFYADSG